MSIGDSVQVEEMPAYLMTICWSGTHMSNAMMLGHLIAPGNPMPLPCEMSFHYQNLSLNAKIILLSAREGFLLSIFVITKLPLSMYQATLPVKEGNLCHLFGTMCYVGVLVMFILNSAGMRGGTVI